VVQRPIVA
jgi:hypothetical protein